MMIADRIANMKVSQRALAKRAGVLQSAVCRAARGENVRVSNALRIARALGVSVEEAFGHLAPTSDDATAAAETPAKEGGA